MKTQSRWNQRSLQGARAKYSATHRFRPRLEMMEDRVVMSTFTVSSLGDAGAGSLRQALIDANAGPGADLINFSVAGTISLTTGALPPVTDPVNIDGSTAPAFTRTPVVEVDAKGFGGLQFDPGSDGSALRSLGVVNAGSDGVVLNAPGITVVGNFVGIRLDGTTTAGNQGNGLVVNATSFNNSIGATTTKGTVISLSSNVISGNSGNGVAIHGSHGHQLQANFIGTDANGTLARGNSGNGILLDQGAHDTLIGGVIPFVNSTNQVPLSNLISGNAGSGVVLTGGAKTNVLGSNFIGTNATGNVAIGNGGDGVAILDKSNDNVLVGTTIGNSPFIFANVISGNGGNGLRVNNSDNTVIHANYFGIGFDNKTPVGNALDGVLFEGSSANTQFGGVIPLGNVSAANGRNGVEIRDTANGTVVFNTFAGLAAFEDYTNLGNALNGMLITSTGGNNIIRTNVIANNHGNGIEIGGDASGVQVVQAIIGLNTDGKLPLPNGGDGILIRGNAHDNSIGGFQSSVIPQSIISANLGHGVAISGTAHNNSVFNNYIGTDVFGRTALGNGGAGVFLASGSFANTVGGSDPSFRNVISGNLGNGIQLSGTHDNIVSGNFIGLQALGRVVTDLLPLLNGGNGIFIDGSSNNLIGGTASNAGNTIAFNAGAGVFVNSGTGNAIVRNSIYNNQNAGIVLQHGANNNQNAPRLVYAVRGSKRTTLGGKLTGAANSTFVIEFFANKSADRTRGIGGRTYLGSATVTTNSKGIAVVRFTTANQPRNSFFTATATSASGNTSAFSSGLPARRIHLCS